MSDEAIPEDVRRLAKAAYDDLLDAEPNSREAEKVIARAILAERAAERERCAKLVEGCELQFVLHTEPDRGSDRPQTVFVPEAQHTLASSIRSSHE